MTDIEPYRDTSVDSWTGVLPDVVRLAQHLAETEFVPKAMRGRPAAVAAAILAGREIGVGPLTALAHINVIEGRPAMSAELMRARILAAGHDLAYDETTASRCVVRGRRRGTDTWTKVQFSMDDARRAGLANRPNWRSWPAEMLTARATARLARLIFADVIGGTPYLVDEVEAAPAQATARHPRRRRATSQTPEATPIDEPVIDGDTLDDDSADDADTPEQDEIAEDNKVTQPQLTRLHALFTHLGVNDRDQRLAAATAIIGRPITSSSQLTADEAAILIDTLHRLDGDPTRLHQLVTAIQAATPRQQEHNETHGD